MGSLLDGEEVVGNACGCGCDEGEGCRALAGLSGGSGGEGVSREARALLGCRSFLWDVVLDGGWTGCARRHLRRMRKQHGAEAVARAFEAQ